MSKFLNSLLFLAAILAIGLVLSGHKENFELMPDNIPSRLLLDGSYPVKHTKGLSDNGNNQQYLLIKDIGKLLVMVLRFHQQFVEIYMVRKILKKKKFVSRDLIVGV